MNKKDWRQRKPWGDSSLRSIPDQIIGVYAFWCRENGKCIYVGMTEDQSIKKRLRDHWRYSHNERLRLWLGEFGENLDICYASIAKGRIRELESRLINLLAPEANKTHNR